jgi:hypothetical protein
MLIDDTVLQTTIVAMQAQIDALAARVTDLERPPEDVPLGELYPGDVGIESDLDVIFASGFETADWYDDFGMEPYTYADRGQRTIDEAFSGNACLRHFNRQGTHWTQWYRPFFDGADTVYLRWYHKFEDGYDLSAGGVKSHGIYAGEYPINEKPNGYNKFSLRITFGKDWRPRLYFYHPEQLYSTGEARSMNLDPEFTIEPGRWYCIEIMLKANDAGVRNGEIKAWFDGELKAQHVGFRFRDTDDLKIGMLYLGAYFGGTWTSPKNQYCWDDNLVLATRYVGPMT